MVLVDGDVPGDTCRNVMSGEEDGWRTQGSQESKGRTRILLCLYIKEWREKEENNGLHSGGGGDAM